MLSTIGQGNAINNILNSWLIIYLMFDYSLGLKPTRKYYGV